MVGGCGAQVGVPVEEAGPSEADLAAEAAREVTTQTPCLTPSWHRSYCLPNPCLPTLPWPPSDPLWTPFGPLWALTVIEPEE